MNASPPDALVPRGSLLSQWLSAVAATLGVVLVWTALSNFFVLGQQLAVDTVRACGLALLSVGIVVVLASLLSGGRRIRIKAPRAQLTAAALFGAGLALPLAAALDASLRILGRDSPDLPRYVLRAAPLTGPQLVTLCAFGVLISAFAEEWAFRGWLLEWLRARLPLPASIALSSLAFGACHGVWLAGLQATLLGVASAMLSLKTRTLGPSIAMHLAFNLQLAAIAGFFPLGVSSSLPERAADLSWAWVASSVTAAAIGLFSLGRSIRNTVG